VQRTPYRQTVFAHPVTILHTQTLKLLYFTLCLVVVVTVLFILCRVFIVCVVLCAVFRLMVVLLCVICVICVLCLIVVPLPSG
jgi:hypothetical protein